MRFYSCAFALILITQQTRIGNAALFECTDDASCVANEPGSVACNTGATSNVCTCHKNYEASGDDCAPKDCSTDDTVCASNSVCTGTTKTCGCKATFEEKMQETCTAISCSTTATSRCTDEDSNSYCNTGNSVCTCKKLFAGATTKNCEAMSCAVDKTCADITANSYCTGTDIGTDTCRCIATMSGDEVGDCTQRTSCDQSATSSTIEATCGGANTVCQLDGNTHKCFCKAGYSSTPTSKMCAQTECEDNTVDSTCGDATSYQCSTTKKCECATGYTAGGSKCKKTCSVASDCHASAGCVSSICECNVNYQGNGHTCTQLECPTSDLTKCHPNSQCSGGKCVCASDYVANGTVCEHTCTSNSGCHSNGICVNERCECKDNYEGDGVDNCTAIACVTDADCTLENSSCNITSKACECSSGYELSTTTSACVETSTNAPTTAPTTAGAGALVFNFSFMATSFLMAIFFNKM